MQTNLGGLVVQPPRASVQAEAIKLLLFLEAILYLHAPSEQICSLLLNDKLTLNHLKVTVTIQLCLRMRLSL